MNYDLVKSFNVSCVKASSGSNYKSLGTNKKESWFKWWYLIFAIPILGLFAGVGFRLIPSLNRLVVSLQLIKFGKPSIDKLILGVSYEEKENYW